MCQADDSVKGDGSSPEEALQFDVAADAGIQIDMLGGNCPVQGQGMIDGEPFYFRARWSSWSLSIGSDREDLSRFGVHGRDVIGRPRWSYDEDYGGDDFSAGWMPLDEARAMIVKGANLFRARTTKDGWNHPDNPWPKVERMEKALREMLNLASNKALTETMSGNALENSWRTMERLCRQGLGE